MKNVFL